MSREINRRDTTMADSLQVAMKDAMQIATKNKADLVMSAHSEALAFRKHIFQTGLFEVDVNLRPVHGSKIQLLGAPHKGKSLLTYIMMGSAAKTCRQCLTPIIDFVHDWTGEVATTCQCGKNDPMRILLVDSENSLDPAWANVWGVPIDPNFDPETETGAKQILENVYMTPDSKFVTIRGADGEAAKLICERMIQQGSIDLLVVDSIAQLMPRSRRDGKQMIGDHAKVITQFVSGIVAAQGEAANADGVAPTILMVNQERVDIGGFSSYGTPMKGTGGEGLKFNNSQTWKLTTKHERSEDGNLFGDSTLRATKDKESGSTHSSANYRTYLRPVRKSSVDYFPGDTDEGGKILTFLKSLGETDTRWYEKKKNKYVIFGREFTKVADIQQFLSRRDVGHLLRLPIYAQKFPPTLRQHLGAENYDYTPFRDDPILEMYDEARRSIGGHVQTREQNLKPVMVSAKRKKAEPKDTDKTIDDILGDE